MAAQELVLFIIIFLSIPVPGGDGSVRAYTTGLPMVFIQGLGGKTGNPLRDTYKHLSVYTYIHSCPWFMGL